MGNVFEQSFVEIWNSACYMEFRRPIRTNELYDFAGGAMASSLLSGWRL